MSSMHRTLDGDVLIHHLTADARTIDPALLARTGRTARTLVKEGPLRLVLVAMTAGAELPRHRADGPVTIQVLEGDVCVTIVAREYPLAVGDVLVLTAEVEHAARSTTGALLLLTVVHVAPGAR
jgi:quercetin dioxygenase-like cupin family protein